ncbi:MAG: site-specific DNA-methyltransferase, partial [Thaumarchaeota archaeon]|nr:site-specific DNA-methyltransferase [Nitrososphaerota archaeon]
MKLKVIAKKRQKPVESGGLKVVDIGTTKRPRKSRPKIKKTVRGESKVKQYVHEKEKRVNNPPVGLVTPESDRDLPAKNYSFDPHLDPQLVWSGKAENSDFGVDTVSLHRHERIDPLTIIGKILKKQDSEQQTLFPFFEKPENILPLRNAIEFYKHEQNWSNRLIAGDSLLVMNSLLEKEGMKGKVQMIYIDPPYGIKYGSNFQPFVNNKDVKDGRDEDLTQEPETVKAFRDTWELGIHSYLTYLRDRLLLAKELLHESGSIFVQISDENVHLVRNILDEVFGKENFVSVISFVKTSGMFPKLLPSINDFLIWYSKDKSKIKYRQLFVERLDQEHYDYVETEDGNVMKLYGAQIRGEEPIPNGRRLMLADSSSQGTSTNLQGYEFEGTTYYPTPGRQWSTTKVGMDKLAKEKRLYPKGNRLFYKRYIDDFPVVRLSNMWSDTQMGGWAKEERRIFVVQTPSKVLERCMLMTTDPSDLVFDPTCGSGTTSYVAEKWGRRWITCDTSRVAITLAKQRLMTASFEYYELAHPSEGVRSGFKYKSVPHVTLSSIAKQESAETEILYDQPHIDNTKTRITGPFTFEAVPSPTVKSLNTEYEKISEIDSSIARTADNRRQQNWR